MRSDKGKLDNDIYCFIGGERREMSSGQNPGLFIEGL